MAQMEFDFATIGDRLDGLPVHPNGKGKALEILAADLFDSLPGVAVTSRNLVSQFGDSEVDLQLKNKQLEDGLGEFARDLIVECKSQGSAVSSGDLVFFLDKLQDRGLREGIFVALQGITGSDKNARGAHQKVKSVVRDGYRLVVLHEAELRGLSSAAHLAVVLDHKRSLLIGGHRIDALDAETMERLDPSRRSIRRISWDAIQESIRQEREAIVDEVLAALDGLGSGTFDEDLERARGAFAAIDREVRSNHAESDDYDPFWLRTKQKIIAAAAAWLALIDPAPTDEYGRRSLRRQHGSSDSDGIGWFPGTELWDMVVSYCLKSREKTESRPDVEHPETKLLLKLCVEACYSIENIDPWDVYGDEYGESLETS